MNSMVMKSEVMNSGCDERRVMDGVVMDGTLTDFLADLQTISNIYAKKHFAINSECNKTGQTPQIFDSKEMTFLAPIPISRINVWH